jgi:hypothetical protein
MTQDLSSSIRAALQHNHWAAVSLLIQAGASWPQNWQPPTWKVPNKQMRRRRNAAVDVKFLEVSGVQTGLGWKCKSVHSKCICHCFCDEVVKMPLVVLLTMIVSTA